MQKKGANISLKGYDDIFSTDQSRAEQNFSTLIEFLNAMEVREDDEEFQNPVDLMFEALEKKKPNHFAVRQYKKYKLAAGDICSK